MDAAVCGARRDDVGGELEGFGEEGLGVELLFSCSDCGIRTAGLVVPWLNAALSPINPSTSSWTAEGQSESSTEALRHP